MASLAWNLVGYYAFETTKTIIWWSGGQVVYMVTPNMIYNWVYPKKSETEKLIEEIRQLRMEFQEANELDKNIPIAVEAVDILETGVKTYTVNIDKN